MSLLKVVFNFDYYMDKIKKINTHLTNLKNTNKLFFFLALIVLGVRLIFSWLDMSYILGRVVDDAFYYFKTAQNIVIENKSTFDGINPTNGYHPLWMACIIPIFYLTIGKGELSIHLVMTLQVIILTLIIFLFWKILDREFGSRYPIVALTFFIWPRFLNQTEYGVEAGLLILLLLVSANYCLKHHVLTSEGSRTENLIFGIILALVFLARLDSIFYYISIVFYLIYNSLNSKLSRKFQYKIMICLKKIFFLFTPASLIPIPYLVW